MNFEITFTHLFFVQFFSCAQHFLFGYKAVVISEKKSFNFLTSGILMSKMYYKVHHIGKLYTKLYTNFSFVKILAYTFFLGRCFKN